MKYKLIDSHCHVHFDAYKTDMEEVVERSLKENVGMVTVGTQSTTSKNAIAIAEKYEGVWATIGLHPNHLHKQEFEDTNEIIKTRSEEFDFEYYRKLAEHPKVVAIGEFGLDYYRIPPEVDREKMMHDQKKSCKEQLRFATEIEKPVIIHSREAHLDQYDIIKAEIDAGGLRKRGVIHCFTGTMADAESYKSLGFKLGINGILNFSKDLQKVMKEIDLNQIMIETDAPYLTPPPHRGKRNEPSYVKYVAEIIAEIKGISFDEVAEVTTANTILLFDL